MAVLRIVSGLAANTDSIFGDGSLEPETANGCPVCARQEPLPRGIDYTLRVLQSLFWALSRAPQEDPCFLLTKTYMDVCYTEAIHFDGLSAFRPCGRDLVEFFNSTVWALYVHVDWICKHYPPSRYLLRTSFDDPQESRR